MLLQSLLAWVWAPLVLFAVCAGLGLLVETLSHDRLAGGLLAPVGFGVAILLVVPAYRIDLPASTVAVLYVVLAIAGYTTRRKTLTDRTFVGTALVAAIGSYILHLAPTAFSGAWTWAGYNFTNDPANTLTATAWILAHGFHAPAVQNSTNAIVAAGAIEQGYPLGPHLLLGTIRELTFVPLVALYQSFIAFAAAMAGMSFAVITRRLGLSNAWAASCGVVATGATLFYNYSQLGGLKEVVTVALLAAATGLATGLPTTRWTARTVAPIAVVLAALIPTLSAGGLVYAGLFAAVVLLAGVSARPRWHLRQVLTFAAVSSAVVIILNVPSLGDALRFGRSVNDNLGVAPLGQLLRPLPLYQVGGIWLAEDWRLPVADGTRATLTDVLLGVVLAFAGLAMLWGLLRRRGLAFAGLLVMVATYAALSSGTTPYGQSKLLVMLSPFVVVAAIVGIWLLATRWRVAGVGVGVIIAAGVLCSDAITYREVRLAPVDRIEAMEDVAHASAGHGLVLHNEWEEWAKYAYRDAQVNSAYEVYLGPKPAILRRNIVELGRRYDLDELQLRYVTSFPAIVQRRSPDASRPPANYRLAYSNRYYELWLRAGRLHIRRHLSIQGLFTSQVKVPCKDIRRFARLASRDAGLVAARRSDNVVLQPTRAAHSPGWTGSRVIEGTVVPTTPGSARGRVRIRGGTYAVWLYGSSGRPIFARIDHREVGQLAQVNSPGSWIQVATVSLQRGWHQLEIVRPGGSLRPGDAYQGRIGPLALQRKSPGTLIEVAPREAGKLCGRALDWIEIVARSGTDVERPRRKGAIVARGDRALGE